MAPMFDIDEFVADCVAAIQEPTPIVAARELLTRTLEREGDVAAALGRDAGGLELLYHSDDLTIVNVVWAPRMAIYPHDHRMWAIIGIYGGAEDNTMYRRTPAGLVESGGKALRERDVFPIGSDAIHSVTNPSNRSTGAIHIYGGDFVDQERSQWNPETLREEPYDSARVAQLFADANAAAAAAATTSEA